MTRGSHHARHHHHPALPPPPLLLLPPPLLLLPLPPLLLLPLPPLLLLPPPPLLLPPPPPPRSMTRPYCSTWPSTLPLPPSRNPTWGQPHRCPRATRRATAAPRLARLQQPCLRGSPRPEQLSQRPLMEQHLPPHRCLDRLERPHRVPPRRLPPTRAPVVVVVPVPVVVAPLPSVWRPAAASCTSSLASRCRATTAPPRSCSRS